MEREGKPEAREVKKDVPKKKKGKGPRVVFCGSTQNTGEGEIGGRTHRTRREKDKKGKNTTEIQ